VLLAEHPEQLLDLQGGDGVEGRTGLVQQDNIGLENQDADDAELLRAMTATNENACSRRQDIIAGTLESFAARRAPVAAARPEAVLIADG
jgi:hypothetical protein